MLSAVPDRTLPVADRRREPRVSVGLRHYERDGDLAQSLLSFVAEKIVLLVAAIATTSLAKPISCQLTSERSGSRAQSLPSVVAQKSLLLIAAIATTPFA